MSTRVARILAAGACLVLLSACAVGPNFKRPAAPSAPGYGSAPSQGVMNLAVTAGVETQRFVAGLDISGHLWTLFQAQKLNNLVEQALKANPNVNAAQAALRQAH